jgi:phosphoserine phosphatase RsbU/P
LSRKRLGFALGLLFFALLGVKVGVGVYGAIWLRATSDAGFIMTLEQERLVVASVFPESPAAELLRAGDLITHINGEEMPSGAKALQRFFMLERRQPPGTPYTVTVRRGEQMIDCALRTIEPPFVFSMFLRSLAYLLTPIVFFLTGLTVYLLKPFDKQAAILALMFGALAGVFGGGSMLLPGDVPVWVMRLMSFVGIISFVFFPLFFHFFLIFPESSKLLRRWPRLENYIYAPYLLVILPTFVTAQLLTPPQRISWQNLMFLLFAVTGLYCFTCVIGGLVALAVKYRGASRLSRRKMRVILAGSFFGFVPLLSFVGVHLAMEMTGIRAISPFASQWMAIAAWLCFLLFPFSFAYAIVRHQVIPIRVILRRGVRYLLVSRGSKILEMVAVGVALVFLLRVFFNYFETADVFTVALVSSVVSIIIWNVTSRLHHHFIAPAINSRFFRRSYNAQNLLAELGGYLRTTTNLHDITAQVSSRVRDALETENVSVFLYDELREEYLCVVTSQYVENDCIRVEEKKELALRGDSSVVQRLRDAAQPVAVDFDEPGSWAESLSKSENHRERREAETLQCIGAALLLPVTTKSGMLGIISVGERLGDLPFSGEDRQMLMSVAYQTAFALENRQLVEQRAEEQRLSRELEMATEVQQRLFPPCAPALAGAELCGVCYPARGVGGDYYDFISLDAGRIGVAVADVAGKGISAALLMSTVQASLRSYAPIAASTDAEITDLISSMNSLLHASTAANSYATFFYAQYDERTRTLTYVNAGHNPPLLVRAGSDESDSRPAAGRTALSARASSSSAATAIAEDESAVALDCETIWLTTGGTVIGIFDNTEYEQETVALQPGDVLVAYTDGVTEATNARREEYGNDRLRESVISRRHLAASAISDGITAELEAWTEGTTPHDDITLVIMKIK